MLISCICHSSEPLPVLIRTAAYTSRSRLCHSVPPLYIRRSRCADLRTHCVRTISCPSAFCEWDWTRYPLKCPCQRVAKPREFPRRQARAALGKCLSRLRNKFLRSLQTLASQSACGRSFPAVSVSFLKRAAVSGARIASPTAEFDLIVRDLANRSRCGATLRRQPTSRFRRRIGHRSRRALQSANLTVPGTRSGCFVARAVIAGHAPIASDASGAPATYD
jgi:hypothetical protein